MDGKILSIFLAVMLSVSTQVSSWGNTYRGAVVEYNPLTGRNDEDTLLKNVEKYLNFIRQAKVKGADIIVFPEFGLFSSKGSPIPDPVEHIAPCDSPFLTTKAVKDLSCAAKDNGIYTVVNLVEQRKCDSEDSHCPPTGFYIYNTNVVFDRRGTVIARYAKYNLFASDIVHQPAEPELSFFDTDFGVRFGTFICFDILFPTPAQRLVQQYGITDFVFSTYWFSELPFLSALQAHRGWAETNNVNLLASGVNNPQKGSSGSGIYNGRYGYLVQTISETERSKLLIADIPKLKKSNICEREAPFQPKPPNALPALDKDAKDLKGATEGKGLQFLRDPGLDIFTTEVIKANENFERTICTKNNFCCDFKVTMDILLPKSNYTYRAMVHSGVRSFGAKFRGGMQACAVVVCRGPEMKDCGNREKGIGGNYKFKEILIKGNFKLRNSIQIPSTLTDGEEVVPLPTYKYEFLKTEKDKSVEVSLELLWPTTNLHTFAIWGRDYTKDMEPLALESGASSVVSAPVLFAAFMSFLVFVR